VLSAYIEEVDIKVL